MQALAARFCDTNLKMRANTEQPLERSYREVGRLEARVGELEKRLGIAPPPHVQFAEPGSALAGEILEVLDPPSLPTRPIKPNRAFSGASGFCAGFAAALVIALLRRRSPVVPFPAQQNYRKGAILRPAVHSGQSAVRTWMHSGALLLSLS